MRRVVLNRYRKNIQLYRRLAHARIVFRQTSDPRKLKKLISPECAIVIAHEKIAL